MYQFFSAVRFFQYLVIKTIDPDPESVYPVPEHWYPILMIMKLSKSDRIRIQCTVLRPGTPTQTTVWVRYGQ